MTVLFNINGYLLTYNPFSKTYFIETKHGDCIFYTESKIKAKNRYKSILSCYNNITDETLKAI